MRRFAPCGIARGLTALALVVASHAFVAVDAVAQDTVFVSRDSARISVRLRGATKRSVLLADAVRIQSPHTLVFAVTDVLSTFHTCSVSEKTTTVPEISALRTFFADIGPLLTDPSLAQSRFQKLKSEQFAGPGDTDYSLAMTLDSLTQVESETRRARRLAARSLADIAAEPKNGRELAADYRALLPKHRVQCDSITTRCISVFGSALVRHLADVDRLVRQLQPPADNHSVARELREIATVVLASDSDVAIALAYDTDAVVNAIVNTGPVTCGAPTRIGWARGATVTATIAPRTHPMFARLVPAAKVERTLSVLPDWFARPTIGVSLHVTDDARFRNYGTTTPASGARGREIYALPSPQDARLQLGLTLGTTWRGLDWRNDARHLGVAVWLPELFIQPLESNRTLGVGAGLSVGFVKLGAGVGWVRHKELRGQVLGQVINDGNELATDNVWGRRLPYWSISLIGVPPFLRGTR